MKTEAHPTNQPLSYPHIYPTKSMARSNMEHINNSLLTNSESPHRFWSELPFDILLEILKNISLFDRIFFRAVCNDWNSVPRIPFVHQDTLPFLMTYDTYDVSKPWKFIASSPDLMYSTPPFYSLQGPDLDGYNKKMDVVCTRKGWLLLRDGRKLVFLCPFNKKIIQLPVLEPATKDIYSKCNYNDVVTFSGTPDQPSDCMVFVVQGYSENYINIRTCRCGNSAWRTYRFDIPLPLITLDVVYNEPMLYCLCSRGILGAFNPVNNEWSILSRSQIVEADNWLFMVREPDNGKIMMVEVDNRTPAMIIGEAMMVENDRNGELMMVCCLESHKYSNEMMVFRFDFSDRIWKLNKLIGNQVIYVHHIFGRWTAFSVGEAKQLANKIYYHDNYWTWSYSLLTAGNNLCHNWPIETPKIWIQPPKVF